MKSLLIFLLLIAITLSSCSESFAPCHTYDPAYKLRSYSPKKFKDKRARITFNTVKI